MFSKSSKPSGRAPSPAATLSATGGKAIPFSLIGSDVTISGNLEATVDLHIDGRVDGDISCAALVLGPDARVTGQVTARSARIAGTVEGGILADELIVEATARITGDVTYDSISIQPGGQVAGQFTHKSGGVGAGGLKLVSGE